MSMGYKTFLMVAFAIVPAFLNLASYDVMGQPSETINETTKPRLYGREEGKSVLENPRYDLGLAWYSAEKAIEAKAAQLGYCGALTEDTSEVQGGWIRRYQDCEIYFGKGTGAHEVHGGIRVKYNALQGANGVLGLPVTDEQGTPDGLGRYNHFQGGSIYWSPRTEAFMVRGPIRDVWAGQGWERGALGYPVADEYVVRPFKLSADHPPVAWALFENGAIVRSADGTHAALAAEVSPDRFKCVLRTFVDREVHKSPDNIGLHPKVEILQVLNWTYGPVPRKIIFRLYGFWDAGLVLPDVDFELDMELAFSMVPGSITFSEPKFKTVVAALHGLRVTAHGLPILNVKTRDGILNGIRNAFYRGGPDPSHPEVADGQLFVVNLPTGVTEDGSGIDIIETLVTPQGGLQILVLVGPKVGDYLGNLRQVLAQSQVDNILGDAGC